MSVVDTLIVIGLSTINLGAIRESGGIQEHTFWLRNASASAVTLGEGYTSCGCTTIDFAKGKAVQPGDSTAVTLRFNPRGKGGEFEEVGTVTYGSRKKHVNLTLTGTCITSEETLMRQFPIRVDDTLRLSTDRFDLGIMHVGETKERNVVVLHTSQGNRREQIPVRYTVEASTPKGLRHITYPIKTGGKRINIILDVLIK